MSIQNGKFDGGQKRANHGPRFTKGQLRRDIHNGVKDIEYESDSPPSNPTPSVEKKFVDDLIRTIRPCALIGLGGAGGQVLRRAKKLLERQQTHKFVTYRLFDTDPTAQTNSDLTDKQFCLVRTSATENALQNPEGHELLVNRFDLNDPVVRTTAEALHKTDQAGQVRFQGCHALLSDFESVRTSLLEMLQELNGTLVRLEKQMEAKNSIRIRDRMKIFLVWSLCGGTGSSMFLEFCSFLRELSKGIEVDIVPICIAASTFEKELLNRPEQWKRVQANAYAGMQELGAFMEGFGTRYAVDLGPDEMQRCRLDSGFANEIFVVGRITADGRDLGSDKAVYDLVATYLAADIGTEISDQLEMDDANQCTLKGLSVDPATGRSRYLATIGANALCLDTDRIASYCAHSAVVELLEKSVVGEATNQTSLKQVIDGWMANPTDAGSTSISISGMAETLKRSSIPNIKGKLSWAYLGQRGRTLLHHRNRTFVAKFNALRNDLSNQATPKFKEILAKCESTLIKSLCESLIRTVQDRVAKHGLAEGVAFLSAVRHRLQSVVAVTQRTANEELRKEGELLSRINENLGKFSRNWLRQFTKSKARQIQLVTDLESSFHLEATGHTHQASARIIGQLIATTVKLDEQMQAAMQHAVALRSKLLGRQEEYRAGRRVTTTSSFAEIDISSSHTDNQLYQRFCPALVNLGPNHASERCQWYLDLCADDHPLEQLQNSLQSFFEQKLESVDVVEIMADQLVEKQTSAEIRAKIRQGMLSTQSAWTANARNNSVQYADALIAGIPESASPAKRQLVVDAMMEAASSRMNANGQYRGTAKHVLAGDKHKILIIRRTHGATWHYLPEVKSCFDAYERWMQSGGHPVHIFNKKTVAKMQSLLPLAKLPPEVAAMAIGLAYGWIAKRGPRFYENLHQAELGNLHCSLSSHFPTVVNGIERVGSDGSKSNRPLDALCASGKLIYQQGDALDNSQLLGESWSEVVAALADQPHQVQLYLQAFDSLRAVAGDEAVVSELDEYLEQLRANAVGSLAASGLCNRVSEALHRKVNDLR